MTLDIGAGALTVARMSTTCDSQPQSLPPVSVAVINYNGATTLGPTLRSVLAQEGVTVSAVVLVDNHSPDDSVAWVRREFPSVRIIERPDNRGPNPARNEGLRAAGTDYVLIMDNDIVLAPDYLACLLRASQDHPEAGALGGRINLYEQPDTVQYNGTDIHFAGEIALNRAILAQPLRVACVSAGAALIDRRKALQVGGFDEDFVFGWEDGDLTFRLSLAGFPCYAVSNAVCYHMKLKLKGRVKWVRYQTRNHWWFMIKNYDGRTLLLALPAILALQGCAALFFLIKGQMVAFLAGTWDVLSTARPVWRKHRHIQTFKRVSDADLLRGDRLDLPGGVSTTTWGRTMNAVLNVMFQLHWRLIRPALKARPS